MCFISGKSKFNGLDGVEKLFSPTHDADWSRLAFGAGSNVDGDTLNGIWVIGDGVSTPRQLMRATEVFVPDVQMMAWSPADTTIAFMSHVVEGAEEIFQFHLRDSSVQLLTSGALLNRGRRAPA